VIRFRSTAGLVVVALIGALVLSACGGSSTQGSNSPTTSGSSHSSTSLSAAATAAVNAAVARAVAQPTSLGYDTKVEPAIPKGKTLAILDCGVGDCSSWSQASADAAAALGWSVVRINEGTSVQSVTTAWNQLLQNRPSAVVTLAIPVALFSQQATELIRDGIPVINESVADPQGEDGVVVIQGNRSAQTAGALMADWILHIRGATANVLLPTSPGLPITSALASGTVSEIGRLCSTCKTAQLSIPAADLGTGANTTDIIGYLRSHPSTNFVTGSGSVLTGLGSALQSAGLGTKVQLLVQSPEPADLAAVKAGTTSAAVAFPGYEEAWKGVDVAARLLVHASDAPAIDVDLPTYLITKSNIKSTTATYPYVLNYQQLFKKMWGVG
jgi:ribose transport system substrate-binding protein